MSHYHVTGYWSDEAEDAFRPLTLEEACSEMADRADRQADFDAESAMIYGESAEEAYHTLNRHDRENPDGATLWPILEDYRAAYNMGERCERMRILNLNCNRFDKGEYHNPDPESERISRLYSLGLHPGANGRYVDTDPLGAYECSEDCVNDWVEYLYESGEYSDEDVTAMLAEL